MARRHAAGYGLEPDRLRFHTADAGNLTSEEGTYDAVFAFECIHDMPRPIDVLTAARQALRPDGIAVVIDEAVGEEFRAPGDEIEQLMYGFSLFVCLPDGLSSAPSVGTGTVMRRSTLRSCATQAGFTAVEVLPINDFGSLRFYHLQ